MESITLLLGTNDLAQGADVHSIVDSIFRTVKWCFSVYGTHIYIIIPLPRVDAKMQQLWELEQLLIARTKIEPMPFVSFINISTDINPLDTPGLYRSSIVRHDMVHLTCEGYREMFALINNIKGTFFDRYSNSLKRSTAIIEDVTFNKSSFVPRYREINGKGVRRFRSFDILESSHPMKKQRLMPSCTVSYFS